eukprot:Hpha_TRINITY_DN16507_c1_g3::TRINITY_DN16507_c1_g3_i1::g.136172::m.136172
MMADPWAASNGGMGFVGGDYGPPVDPPLPMDMFGGQQPFAAPDQLQMAVMQINQMQNMLLHSMAAAQGAPQFVPAGGGTMASGSGGPMIAPRRRKRSKKSKDTKEVARDVKEVKDGSQPQKKTGKVLCNALITPVSASAAEQRKKVSQKGEKKRDPSDGKMKTLDEFLMDHARGADFSPGEELWKSAGGTLDTPSQEPAEPEFLPELLEGSESEEELVTAASY